jgi:recombination protein RecA
MSHPPSNGTLADKRKALEFTLSSIEKQFGEGSIMTLGKHSAQNETSVIPTGALSLDLAIGIGGVPRGRIIEIYGPESSGKSTLATHIVANAQKQGGLAAYIDAEHALDPTYAARIGVNVDDLLISQPSSGEEALNIAEMLARSGAVDIIVVDSVAALVPKSELEGEIGDNHVGLQARMMSQALRKLTATLSRSNTCCIFINQIREKIGVMFGNPETTTGGRALKFYSSLRMDIRRISSIKVNDSPDAGNRVRVKIAKNKLAPPFRQAEFDILFNEGISREGCLLDMGIDTGVIEKKGAWISFNGQRLGQGREQAREELKRKPALAQEIETLIYARARASLGSAVPAEVAETADV